MSLLFRQQPIKIKAYIAAVSIVPAVMVTVAAVNEKWIMIVILLSCW